VLFIDEAEQLLADRKHSHAAAFTNKLLTRMDGTKSNLTDIFVIAATNFREGLDEACLGGGRFSEKSSLNWPRKPGTACRAKVACWPAGPDCRQCDR
jgi:transitional endoplasmic reticulum ATPase